MQVETFFPHEVARVFGVPIRDTVVVTWALMLGLTVVCAAGTRRLQQQPSGLQNFLEAIIEALDKLVMSLTSQPPRYFVPFVGTLAVFLVTCNFAAIFPGTGAPTRDLNTTAALAAVVFVSVHFYGLVLAGPRRYLKTYVDPSWILLPFNIIGEITRTIALALRLFGNMLSGGLTVVIAALLAGFLVPVPLQLFGLLTGVIQAYVFTLLAMVYVAAGVGTSETSQARTET